MKKTEYNKLIDYLNLIDEQAEHAGGDYDEEKAREKAYNAIADFIDKKAKHNLSIIKKYKLSIKKK